MRNKEIWKTIEIRFCEGVLATRRTKKHMSTECQLYTVHYMRYGRAFTSLVYTTPAGSAGEAIDLVEPRFQQDIKEFGLSPDGFSVQTSILDPTQVQRVSYASCIWS